MMVAATQKITKSAPRKLSLVYHKNLKYPWYIHEKNDWFLIIGKVKEVFQNLTFQETVRWWGIWRESRNRCCDRALSGSLCPSPSWRTFEVIAISTNFIMVTIIGTITITINIFSCTVIFVATITNNANSMSTEEVSLTWLPWGKPPGRCCSVGWCLPRPQSRSSLLRIKDY